jgi:hypothetical protein
MQNPSSTKHVIVICLIFCLFHPEILFPLWLISYINDLLLMADQQLFAFVGDDPEEVKARLKYWAQTVACTVKLCSWWRLVVCRFSLNMYATSWTEGGWSWGIRLYGFRDWRATTEEVLPLHAVEAMWHFGLLGKGCTMPLLHMLHDSSDMTNNLISGRWKAVGC